MFAEANSYNIELVTNMNKPFLTLQIRPEKLAADDEYQAFLRAGDLSPDDTVRVQLDRQSIPDDIDVRD